MLRLQWPRACDETVKLGHVSIPLVPRSNTFALGSDPQWAPKDQHKQWTLYCANVNSFVPDGRSIVLVGCHAVLVDIKGHVSWLAVGHDVLALPPRKQR